MESRVPPVDYGRQLVSGSLGEQWDSPPGSPTAAPKGRSSPDVGSSHMKLFARPAPEKMTKPEAIELFSRYGTVTLLERSREMLYITMDRAGAGKAMAALDGKLLPGQARPFVVQKYRSRRSPPSSPPRQRPSGSLNKPQAVPEDHTKLFVKPVPLRMSQESLSALFSKYGTVYKIVPHFHIRNATYVYMDTKGGVRAITALHGKLIAKNSTPLVVDISHDLGSGTRRDAAKEHSSRLPPRPS